MLDLKPATDDQQRLKTNVLPGQVSKFRQKQSYLQPPVLNTMYDAEKQMQEIMEAPQITAAEKSKLYSDQLNRFLTKPNFLTPRATVEELPKLKRNFSHNWVDSSDWTPKDIAMMTPEQFEGYKRRLLRERPKYVPMKPEVVARLSPEDKKEFEKLYKKHLNVMLLEADLINFLKTI